VIKKLSPKFRVTGLAAGRNIELLYQQVKEFKPLIISVERREDAEEFKKMYSGPSLKITFGQEGAEEVAHSSGADIVVSAITGIAGLRSTLAAVRTAERVALANKESMVVAGSLIQNLAQEAGTEIIPIDSEHSGVFQCLNKERKEAIKRVILTASGGPFFNFSPQEIREKTLEEALNHPRWKMGKKVSIDSATLMNKGLELIEAKWLFGLQPEQLEVLIHPESIVHSLVEMKDGSLLAQLSPPDMRIPIQYALTYPEREEQILPSLDLRMIRTLDFYEVNHEKFPLLLLARKALVEGESYPVALNAANEVAVEAFLRREIKFLAIADIVFEAVEKHKKRAVESMEEILDVDQEIRMQTKNLIRRRV